LETFEESKEVPSLQQTFLNAF